MMKTISLTAALLAIAALGVGAMASAPYAAQEPASHAPATHAKAHSHDHVHYVKPGAAVELLHDYDGQTRIGELETVTLTLAHIYSQGIIHATLIAPEGLTLTQTNQSLRVDLYDSTPIALPVQFSSSHAGRYTLGIDVIYESRDGHQTRRALALPIIIGQDASAAKSQGHVSPPHAQKSKGGVIVLPAQEVIR